MIILWKKFFCLAKSDIQLESQHPEGLKKIVELERGQEPLKREEAERSFEKPIFTQLLTGPSELIEGQHAHFECRVVPVGDPTLRFEWYVNGVELKMGKLYNLNNLNSLNLFIKIACKVSYLIFIFYFF